MKSPVDEAFPSKDLPLRHDVGLLGRMLGDVLKRRGGAKLYEQVEAARIGARRWRESESNSTKAIESSLRGLEPDFAREVVRAFSTYFELVNTAERVHRIRRRRAYLRADAWPQPGSLAAVIGELVRDGMQASDLDALLSRTVINPVFTAHPTEATRRTLLVKEQRMARAMVERIEPGRLLAREEEVELAKIRNEIDLGWQTEEHAHARPTVADEVEHVVFYLSEVVYRIVPAFFDEVDRALQTHFGTSRARAMARPRLQFGSWVGGDMDGNPNVGAHTIRATLTRHRALVLDKYLAELRNLVDHMSQSSTRTSVPDALQERLTEYRALLPELASEIPTRYRDMPYRNFLWYVGTRLERTTGEHSAGYGRVDEFRDDLALLDSSVGQDGGGGADLLERLRRRVDTFGFHLATLDVRQDAMVHRQVLIELLQQPGFPELPQRDRSRLLEEALEEGVATLDPGTRSDQSEASLDVMRAIREGLDSYGRDAFGPYIISMTQGSDDALAVLYLARAGGLVDDDNEVPLDVAPLLETVPDLERGAETLCSLFANTTYREHLRQRHDQQIVMLGYSDSNKESGIASSRWALQRAQQSLLDVARSFGVELVFFHGRGGSVSRGGSRPRHAILAEPPGAINGRLRVTEQGEIIHAKYGLRDIALRTLELNAGAVLEASSRRGEPPPKDYVQAMQMVADTSRSAYRKLVSDDPKFIQYFRAATPIDVIERLRIGSRPASRRSGDGIENLRAIPWVFSWTQARHLLPGWFGFGAGVRSLIDLLGINFIRKMIAEWRFFDTLVSDVEMTLAKADMTIAARYADLAGSVGNKIFPRIKAEYQRACDAVCEIRDSEKLLARDRVLRRAIALRNPYVDPMTFIQLDLLARWRAGDRQDKDLEKALVATVQGIARGMRNTG